MAAETLQELVSAAASVYSDRIAVTYDGHSLSDSPVSLLYRDLLQLAAELSHILQLYCAQSNGVIGLYCCDDLYIPVWILGILQFPAAYVPLDLEAPGLLSARVMDHCGLKYCAVKTDLLQHFQAVVDKHASVEVCVVLPKFKLTLIRVQLLSVDKPKQEKQKTVKGVDLRHTAAVEKDSGYKDLAYVLHTSGTTGLPKIVRVPHKCILPNILHLRSLFQMSADDVVFLASPLTFDPSVVDIFLALSSGAQLLIIPSINKKMPSRLAQMLFKDHKTTVLQVTPTLLCRFGRRILEQEVFSSGSSLRVLALGGESCPSPSLLRSWRHEDNNTHIFNIYGITEVSCWACCYEIPQSLLQSKNPPSSIESSVPLGSPLMDTVVEVRDEHGCSVTDGEGQVFIGGKHRVCLLDDEEAVIPGTMRATGDWVTVQDTHLFYLGRRDRLIKRHGKRVNLDSLQQLILTLPQVEACAVGLYEGIRLLAFVVVSTSGDQRAASPLPSVQQHVEQSPSAQHQEELHSLVRLHQEEMSGAERDPSRLILNQLSLMLPSYSVPDALVLVPALCLTPHGKVDMDALRTIYKRQRRCLKSPIEDVSKLKQTLQSLWQGALGFAKNAIIDEESNFLLSGGDSLKALHLCEDILNTVGVTAPELLEVILGKTFADVLDYVATVTLMEPLRSSTSSLPEDKKRHADAPAAVLAKRERKEPQEEKLAFKVIRRGGEVIEMNVRKKGSNLQADAVGDKKSSKKQNDNILDFCLSWSSDTGRCVDASPVLLVHKRTAELSNVPKTSVFIGSHSHRIQALDLDTGNLLWERVLGGRIEASAAVSHCGTLVIIGCYDGCVYFLCAASGKTKWIFETGDAVKSCPAVDQHTGLVIVGSHDGHVYALDPKLRRCVWKRHCGGGAVFSSPYLQCTLRQLYVASLGGHLLCLNPDNGDVLWSDSRDVPFFSSPNGCSGLVAIGCVNGDICCYSNTGKLVWHFSTKGPVFSSPCFTLDRQRLLCGSHDGQLYCLNSADGALVWTFQTSGKVYSTPCVFDGSTVGRSGILVVVASTDGKVWILDGENGQLLASHVLSGELFSSPVVYEQFVVIGCRNDYVYCLKLTVKEET